MPADQEEMLANLRAEYHTTVQHLAVVVERLMLATGERVILVSRSDLTNSPDLVAQHDPGRGRTTLTTAR